MIVALILSVLLLSTTLVGVCVLYEQTRRKLRRPRSIQILLPRADDGVIGVTVDGKPMPAGWNLDVSYEFGEPEQPSVATELERSRIDAVREVHGSHSGEVVGFYTEGWVDRKTFRESAQTYMRENGWDEEAIADIAESVHDKWLRQPAQFGMAVDEVFLRDIKTKLNYPDKTFPVTSLDLEDW